MPDNHNSTMRNWARRVSIDTAQSAHDPQKLLDMQDMLQDIKTGQLKLV